MNYSHDKLIKAQSQVLSIESIYVGVGNTVSEVTGGTMKIKFESIVAMLTYYGIAKQTVIMQLSIEDKGRVCEGQEERPIHQP